MLKHVDHGLPPWYNEDSHTLILGTLPSPSSREKQFYYGHPQNRFWSALASIFNKKRPQSPTEGKIFLQEIGLALWDVLSACDINGASDASITNPVVNQIDDLLNRTNIYRIFCTGKTAHQLYNRLILPTTGLVATCLPSPSPANQAHWPMPSLLKAYEVLKNPLNDNFPLKPNLYDLPSVQTGETVTILYEDSSVRIEQIVSFAHASPAQGYYVNNCVEWVSILQGAASLMNDQETITYLKTGDHIKIPKNMAHRVCATTNPCIWLCVFSKNLDD